MTFHERVVSRILLYAISIIGIAFYADQNALTGMWVAVIFFWTFGLYHSGCFILAAVLTLVAIEERQEGSLRLRFPWIWRLACNRYDEPQTICQLFWNLNRNIAAKPGMAIFMGIAFLFAVIFYLIELALYGLDGRFPISSWREPGKLMPAHEYGLPWRFIAPWKVLLPLGIAYMTYVNRAFFVSEWHGLLEAWTSFHFAESLLARCLAGFAAGLICSGIVHSQRKKIEVVVKSIRERTCLLVEPPVPR